MRAAPRAAAQAAVRGRPRRAARPRTGRISARPRHPRRDTKPLARKLIEDFGGFGQLLSADAEAIVRVSEVAAAAIKIAQAAALRLLESGFRDQPILASWQALLDYLRADMAFNPVERVRVLYLNSKNMLLRNEPVSEGSVDEAAVYVREVIRRPLEYHATA